MVAAVARPQARFVWTMGSNALRFNSGDGAQIQRTVDLGGAAGATLAYTVARNGLDGGADGDSVTVFFSRNGVDFVQVDQITNASALTPRNIDLSAFGTGPFTANAAIRFVTNALEDRRVCLDRQPRHHPHDRHLTTAGDTLNGGLGDDTYSFTLGDGNDVINEDVNATSGGTADRISILAPIDRHRPADRSADPAAEQPVNADSNTGTHTGDLVINYTMPTGSQQTITVTEQFTGANAQTGVERINFNGATVYWLRAWSRRLSDQPRRRRCRSLGLDREQFIVGEQGVNDDITGGCGNDLIFGGNGDNDLVGGLGDDLLVGGTGNDRSTLASMQPATISKVRSAPTPWSAVPATTPTASTTFSTDRGGCRERRHRHGRRPSWPRSRSRPMANVENLTYMGVDADQFVGTGNALNNVITGGDPPTR